MKNAITKRENNIAWTLINSAVSPERSVTSTETDLSKDAFNEGFQMMQAKDDYTPDVVLVNAKRAGDVRGWGANDLDPTTMREVWRNAGVGNIWGADVIIWNDLADDEVFFIDTTRMGVMPIKQDFVTYDDPTAIQKFRQRVLGYEEIGMAVVDADAIVKVALSIT